MGVHLQCRKSRIAWNNRTPTFQDKAATVLIWSAPIILTLGVTACIICCFFIVDFEFMSVLVVLLLVCSTLGIVGHDLREQELKKYIPESEQKWDLLQKAEKPEAGQECALLVLVPGLGVFTWFSYVNLLKSDISWSMFAISSLALLLCPILCLRLIFYVFTTRAKYRQVLNEKASGVIFRAPEMAKVDYKGNVIDEVEASYLNAPSSKRRRLLDNNQSSGNNRNYDCIQF